MSIHNRRFQIDVLALQALFHDAWGQKSGAVEKLSQALAFAEPGGFIRVFVDLGPPMAVLLRRLNVRGVRGDYVGQILAAFAADERAAGRDGSDSLAAHPTSSATAAPEASLTNREVDIVHLLEQRYRNNEIAEKLNLSVETVKTHLHNLSKELTAKNRRDAVAKARDMGILSHRH